MDTKLLFTLSSLALWLAAQSASAFPTYPSRIPSGGVNTCINCHGPDGPPLNAFGEAFKAAGRVWTAALAGLDSDGDGFTNGQELGNPGGAISPIPGAQVTLPGDAASKPVLTPPAVSISSPASGAAFPAPFTGPITATVGDAAFITQVEFFSGASSLGIDTSSPYSQAVSLGAGSYSLTARATDYLGAVNTSAAVAITVNPAAMKPVITMQPASQTVVEGANVTFTVAASGSAPLSYQWKKNDGDISSANSDTLALDHVTSVDAASYTVVVSNAAGSAASDAATLTVNPPVALSVSLTSPADGAVFNAPANVPLAASVAPPGNIAKVEFFSGASLLGTATAAPYTLMANNLGVGSHTFTAKVTDNLNATATSAAATISVVEPPVGLPVVAITPVDASASEAGPDAAKVQVARTGGTASELTVYYTLAGAAVNGVDYQALPGSVTIPAGSSSADILVTPIPDALVEGPETVELHLIVPPSGPATYEIGAPAAVEVTIADSPVTPPGNQPPVVKLVKPEDGARISNREMLVLIAEASDPDGKVVKVEFFAGDASLGVGIQLTGKEDNEDEHEADNEHEDDDDNPRQPKAQSAKYVLMLKRLPAAAYVLTAKATDDLGATRVSDPVHITSKSKHRRHLERD